jgi:SAM-dependent methyltransferase
VNEVFDEIYRSNAWEGVESLSGPGSGSDATRALIPQLLALIERLEVKSVLDVGCGDGYWTPDLPGYIGVDVSQMAIDLARVRHPERDYRIDLEGAPLERCDLALVRHVMQHLSLEDGRWLLTRVRASGAQWLLATTYMKGANRNVETGDGYHIDLRKPPFDLGEPAQTLADPGGSWDLDCRLGLWALA